MSFVPLVRKDKSVLVESKESLEQMKNLIKKSFDLWIRKRWLKIIAKEVAKRDKLLNAYHRKVYVVGELVKEYNKLYPEALLKVKGVIPNDR